MISIQQAQFDLGKQSLHIEQLQIKPSEFWVVIGGNGSGKTAFSRCLSQRLPLLAGQSCNSFQRIALSSFEQQQKIIEQIFRERNNDCVSPDDLGMTARQLILSQHHQPALCEQYAELLHIRHLLERPFIQLSTGESRKVLLCQQLVSQPDLLILDEPFEGLDQQSVRDWRALLAQLQRQFAIVLIINRLNDIPQHATHLALLDQLSLILQGEKAQIEQDPVFQQLVYAEQAIDVPLPASLPNQVGASLAVNPFELHNVTIQYGEKKILDQLNWQVERKQHWWIKGPNGAGKSTLLSILTGDHPQSYANDVWLFGIKRGSGESIWQIKQHIGYVSSQLHMDYRVNCSVRDVIISGFFDSIGVYQAVPDVVRLKADEWLVRLNLSHLASTPFRSLSWGQQRLLLITRAMVKYPPVLILDEPLQALDGLNRKLVKHFIEQLVQHSQTQLIFVSHQDQDAPNCITHLFEFVPTGTYYVYKQTPMAENR